MKALDSSFHRLRVIIVIGFVLAGLVLAAVRLGVEREDMGWMDAVTGTMKYQTVWGSGDAVVRSDVKVTESALDRRLRAMGVQWEPQWRKVMGTRRSGFGIRVIYSHGRAPPIYFMAFGREEFLQTLLDGWTDEQVRTFVIILQIGTDDEQRAAVDSAIEEGRRRL